MGLRQFSTMVFVAALATAASGVACRKAEQPAPRAGAEGATAAAPGTPGGTQPAGGGAGATPAPVAEPEPDWSGLADEEVARRSGIPVDECRLALAELRYCPEVPVRVAINEACELARLYCGDEAVGFVNGLLDRAARDLAATGRGGEAPGGGGPR